MEIKEKVIVIGATGGVGQALCHTLKARGAQLFVGGRNSEKVAQLSQALDCGGMPVDASKLSEVESFFKEAAKNLGEVTGVACLAGSLLLKPAHSTSEEEWRSTLENNLFSSFFVTRTAASLMRRQGGGSIVLMSSVAARLGLANHEAIAAAKAGVEGLAVSAAATYAPYKIRVNAVAPGLTKTPLTEKITSHEGSAKASLSMHPLNRFGEPQDIASAISWFLSPEQSWVTGQVLGVDGGLSHVRSNRVGI